MLDACLLVQTRIKQTLIDRIMPFNYVAWFIAAVISVFKVSF